MKKQIYYLISLLLAITIGSINAYGQVALSPRTTPNPIVPLTCTAGDPIPLHPFPGVAYTYTMDGTTGAEQADQWTWFATKDPNFIVNGALNTATMLTAPGDLLVVSGNYGTPGASNSVTITWSPEILAATEYQGDATGWATASALAPTPTFVVGYATGANCADNIQVYEINPRSNFTIDIANILADGSTIDWGVDTEQCVDDVQSAVYNSGTKQIDMDYGTNTLYFEVTAANFVNNWTPTFRLISGLIGTQTAEVTIHSTYADAVADANVRATTSWTSASVGADWATGTQFTAADADDVADGVSLFVKVVISNVTHESLVDNPFVLAVDAIDNNGAGIWDMEDDDCTSATDAADQVDEATHTITPRPTIIMNGGAMEEPSGLDPEDLIIKTP